MLSYLPFGRSYDNFKKVWLFFWQFLVPVLFVTFLISNMVYQQILLYIHMFAFLQISDAERSMFPHNYEGLPNFEEFFF